MDTNLIESSVTAEQISEARDWVADNLGSPFAARLSARTAVRYVVNNYPGGWSAFVAECCTFVQL